MPSLDFYSEITASYYGFAENNDGKRKHNALVMFLSMTRLYGWSQNATYALIGNVNSEGCLNPHQWQVNSSGTQQASNGFGFVQWTPSYKLLTRLQELGYSTTNCNSTTGAQQCLAIHYDCTNGIQFTARPSLGYNMTGSEFATSDADLYTLAGAWLYCYERPAVQNDEVHKVRYNNALVYKEYIESILAKEDSNDPYLPPSPNGESVNPDIPIEPDEPTESDAIRLIPQLTSAKIGDTITITAKTYGNVKESDVLWKIDTDRLSIVNVTDNVISLAVLASALDIGGAYYGAYWSQDETIEQTGFVTVKAVASIAKERSKKWLIYSRKIL